MFNIDRIGTKDHMRSWLRIAHKLSYTAYSKLPTELKLKIQKQYRSGADAHTIRTA